MHSATQKQSAQHHAEAAAVFDHIRWPRWQPLSTMPKDGSVVLCRINFLDTVTVVSARYEPVHGCFCMLPLSASGHNYSPLWPTHWMPLPPTD